MIRELKDKTSEVLESDYVGRTWAMAWARLQHDWYIEDEFKPTRFKKEEEDDEELL